MGELWKWVIARRRKSLEVHAWNSLHCREWSVKGDSHEDSEEERCRESLHLREHLGGLEQNSGRIWTVKVTDEFSDGNVKHVIGN